MAEFAPWIAIGLQVLILVAGLAFIHGRMQGGLKAVQGQLQQVVDAQKPLAGLADRHVEHKQSCNQRFDHLERRLNGALTAD